MTEYVVRRILSMIVVIYFIFTITFVLAYLVPANPARAVAGPRASQETIAQIREDLGLDDPLHVQYVRYLNRVLHGDLGTSYRQRLEVSDVLLRRLPATAKLAVSGIIVQLMLGLPVGVISAIWQRSVWDRSAMLFALFGVSAPTFWLGIVLLYLFAFRIPIFPLGGAGGLWHLVLPAFTLGVTGAAWYARMLRSSMLDVLSEDYIRTARAKGLRERAVLIRHALRNAIQPIVTMIGMDMGYYLGGLVIIEMVFSWPGVGYEMWNAITNLDLPIIMGTITLAAVAIVIMNFIVDLLYAVLDPRVRLT